MTIDRRAFLVGAALAAGLPRAARSAPQSASRKLPPGHPISVSTYSFWQFRHNHLRDLETCIDLAGDMGFDAVEILHRQMENEANDFLQRLKRRAFLRGLSLSGLSTHQTFLSPDKAVRKKNIDHTIHCIELAYALGIPSMRVNTGTWGTSKDFDELMKNRGMEPPLKGCTDEDGFRWAIEGLGQCLKTAERLRSRPGAGKPLGAVPYAGGSAARGQGARLAVAAGDARRGQLPGRSLRSAGPAGLACLHGPRQDVLRRRPVVHPGSGLSALPEYCKRCRIADSSPWSMKGKKTHKRRYRRVWLCCVKPLGADNLQVLKKPVTPEARLLGEAGLLLPRSPQKPGFLEKPGFFSPGHPRSPASWRSRASSPPVTPEARLLGEAGLLLPRSPQKPGFLEKPGFSLHGWLPVLDWTLRHRENRFALRFAGSG